MKIIGIILLSSILGLGIFFFGRDLGLIKDRIQISGTGSMYPTFPKGQGTDSAGLAFQTVATVPMLVYPGGLSLGQNRYFSRKLHRGDIVSFRNTLTDSISLAQHGKSEGFVKRLIGLPGDTFEIRDGFVRINDTILVENYTASPRSTYGGQSIPDCRLIVIPTGFGLVLGDNRKASNDSRQDLGLISLTDIDHVLPMDLQSPYQSGWRQANTDILQARQSQLVITDFLNILNEKRRENKLKPLIYNSKLESSALSRANIILRYNDFSFEATKSGYTMEKAMADAGYSTIVWGETPTLGYYTAEELLDNFFAFPKSRDFLLNPDFQETGIATRVGDINGCPAQIVVQHFGGYKPPGYSKAVVDSWSQALDSSRESLASWQKLSTNSLYSQYRDQILSILDKLKTRTSRLEAIVAKMQADKWLSDQESSWVDSDADLVKSIESQINSLNQQIISN